MEEAQASLVTYVFSLFAQYILPRGREVWIGTLIQALGTLGFSGAPRLPSALLPEDWPRPSAYQLFKTLQHASASAAEAYFDTIYRNPKHKS